ncbi:fragile site-associated protein, partial [Plakobranchus ocellatus]
MHHFICPLGVSLGVTPSPKRRLSRTSSRDRERDRDRDAGDAGSLSSTLGRSGGTDATASTTSPYPLISQASAAPATLSAPSIGFIMCECGLEDVSVTAVRRLGYQDTTQEAQEVEEKLVGLDRTISHMEESARTKVEGETEHEQGKSKGKTSTAKSDSAEEVRDEGKEEKKESNTGKFAGLIPPSGNVRFQSLSSESGSQMSSKDSSWASDHSAVSSDTPVASAAMQATLPEPLEGDASNGRLELKAIWFYFASPPPISIHKKVDYTRLDWNLLSTATPAIDAWLNPSDRLMTSVRSLVREYSRRLCCVVACMMIEGLECQGIHVAYKSKFNKLTPLSKTLQEDPSNQLLTVLRKYLHKYGTDQVERAVSAETLPQLITVQKGILALMRQWKNVLYMPNLSQVNFKSRRSIRPYNVKFVLPKEENQEEIGVGEEQEEVIVDQFDVVDERMSLLQAEGGITQRSGSVPSIGSKRLSVSTQGKTENDFASAESYSVSAKPRKLSSLFRSKIRGQGAVSDSPLDHSSSNLAPPPVTSGLLLSRNDSNMSFTSMSSSSNDHEMLAAPTPPHTPLRHSGPKQSILKNKYRQNEDLYQWMAKQQTEKDQFRMDLHDEDEASRYLRQNTSESCTAAPGHLGSAWSQDDSKLDVNDGGDYTMATSIMQLADAQILFKPVLQSLGLHVESVRPSAMMKKFGGHLLLQGHFTTFKILIAESEARPGETGQPYQHPSKGKGRGKRSINNKGLPESAAFLCESFDVNVSLEDVVDFGEDGQASKFPYKFAMHKLEAKPTTLQINLLVNCRAIRQNVDMALLRLAHQVLTMVGNVKDTRVELKQKRMETGATWVQTHRKQDSKDSTSSVETNQSDTSHTEHLLGSFTNILALEKDRELMLAKARPGMLTPLSSRTSQDCPQQLLSSPQQLQKNLGQALDSCLISGSAHKPQGPAVPLYQYQPSPAAVVMGLAPGVRPVSSPMTGKRLAASSQRGQVNTPGLTATGRVTGGRKLETAETDGKAEPSTRLGSTRTGSPFCPAAAENAPVSSPAGPGKPGTRPEMLPIVDGMQAKKPSQLRFAKDSKGDHTHSSTKKISTPHPIAAHGVNSALVSSSDVLTPPHSLNLSDCTVVLDMADTSSPALNQKTIVDEIKESTPQCWRHLYQLLELYATMPEPKTVSVPVTQAVSKLPVIEEEDPDQEGSVKRESRVSDYGSKLSTLIQNRKSSMLHSLRRDSSADGHELTGVTSKLDSVVGLKDSDEARQTKVDVSAKEEETLGNNSLAHQSFIRTRFKQSIYVGESIPLIVYGILKVEKVLISAELSGLKLEANTTKVHASGTYKKKVKGFLHRVSSDSSYTAHVGHSMINLREGEPPDWQTVVTININKSQGLLTSVMRRGKEHNSTLVTIGVIDIDIPQHPVILHDMMSRSSKRITATLQELRWPAQSNKMHFSSEDNSNQSASNIAAAAAAAASDTTGVSSSATSGVSSSLHGRGRQAGATPAAAAANNNNVAGTGAWRQPTAEDKIIRKHLHIKAVLQGIKVGASILPSLKAQYKTDAIKLTGVLGRRAHFTVTLPTHMLSFKSRITAAAALAETPIPSGASIDLPPIQVIADYRVQKPGGALGATFSPRDDHNEVDLGEELQLLQGSYLYAVAEVGMLEHSLTTDLLNHLVFVQKVFMKEINEIVQKVSGTGPVDEVKAGKDDLASPATKPLLYSVSVRFKGIQVTATTPTSNAVRFETGAITLDLSNRFHLPKKDTHGKSSAALEEDKNRSSQKMFIQAVVDLNLALGQLLKNLVFEEAEPEFHTMAFFKTTIKVRNALQHEMIPTLSHDQEALLINLSRPIILAQPLAFDKAVLVWLNYKNAYEYWTEQRMALNKEVLHATRQVIDKLPHMTPATSPSISTLFLQLTVDDMGICVPLLSSPYQPLPAPAPGFQSPRVAETEQGSALVLTVESTQISACSSGSLVSKGKFKNFCVRFADDFGSSWDDWKPWPSDSGAVMNQCNVPSGTYEVCSRTINKQDACSRNAKWVLNVQWEMKGIDVHLDTDIGKRFTLLGHTLTLLSGEGEEELLLGGDTNTPGSLRGLGRDGTDGVDGKDEGDEDDALSSPDTRDNSLEDLQLLKRRTSLASDILPEEIFLDTFDPKERVRKIEREMNEQAKIVQELKECGATEGTIEIERKKLEDLQALLFQDFRRDFMEKLKRQGDRANIIKDKLGLGTRPASHIRSKSTGTHRMPGGFLSRHRSIDVSAGERRQSEDLTRMPKVSFSGHQLSTYTPPGSPDLHTYAESESERDDDDTITYSRQRSRSLEAIPSSGSDSQLDESLPYRRKKTASEDSSSVTSRDQATKLAEQNVDFELDVKVFIDSGKCVLYPKEAKEEEVRKYAKKEKLVPGEAGSSNGGSSPPSKRKLKKEVSGASISSRRKLSNNPDTTIFFVPSLAVKVHYNSKTDHMNYMVSPGSTILEEYELSPASYHTSGIFTNFPNQHMYSPEANMRAMDADSSGGSGGGGSLWADYYSSPRRSNHLKKASLYAWITLQTLPEEMIISPTLLDFLEQALEPLPVNQSSSSSILKKDMMDSLVNNMDLDASQVSLGQQSMAFFPVDVVVHIKVDPSFIRFNCHPVSRVECLLQVPSLDLFFSTKKSDINDSMLADIAQYPRSSESHAGRNARQSGAFSTPQNPNTGNTGGSCNRSRHTSGLSDTSTSTAATAHTGSSSSSGGLSVTGCMSDFSLYIFHPYGTGVQRRLAAHGDLAYKTQPGLERIAENATNAIHDLGRRDSLSLNVEYIRVNISRTRKLETYSEPAGDTSSGGGVKVEQQVRSNAVRFSAICDIGTASFKYDMRRLSEILSLPKAWYRRTLARRLFLGDDSMNVSPGDESEPLTPEHCGRPVCLSHNSVSHPTLNEIVPPPTPLRKHHRRGSSGDKIRIQLSPEFKTEIASRR